MGKARDTIKLGLILVWLVFTVTFAVWWFKFSFEHIQTLAQLQPERAAHWERQQRMITWEGGTWLLLLVSGGAALIGLVQMERQRVRRIREFFASFSHDVKTSLASLRLQAESLADETPDSPVLQRLIGDTVRLQLQLENSLFLSSQEDIKLYVERLSLSELVERLRDQWPTVRFDLARDAWLTGDERAVRTILSNLAKNAISHGHATEIRLEVMANGEKVQVHFHDNGQGFEGSTNELGKLFHRPMASSGSGVGLYISRLLAERMGGALTLHADRTGFGVDLEMPGALK